MLHDLDKETGDRLSKIVDEACFLLADYNGRLAAELEDRTAISKMLAAFIQLQKDKLAESEKKLEVIAVVSGRIFVGKGFPNTPCKYCFVVRYFIYF